MSTLHPTHTFLPSLVSTPFYKGGQGTIILVHLVVAVSFIKKLNSLAVHEHVFTWQGHSIYVHTYGWCLHVQVWVPHIAHVKFLLLYFSLKVGPKNTKTPYKTNQEKLFHV